MRSFCPTRRDGGGAHVQRYCWKLSADMAGQWHARGELAAMKAAASKWPSIIVKSHSVRRTVYVQPGSQRASRRLQLA